MRSRGLEPQSRGKRWKSHELKNPEEAEKPQPGETEKSRLVNLTKFVETGTDIPALLAESFAGEKVAEDGGRFGLVGLHTCGNLASSSLRIFLASASARFLFNVGCCYHMLDEEFYRNVYLDDAQNDAQNANAGFPLSADLRQRRFELGRNARMLAAQPMDRMATNQQVRTCERQRVRFPGLPVQIKTKYRVGFIYRVCERVRFPGLPVRKQKLQLGHEWQVQFMDFYKLHVMNSF